MELDMKKSELVKLPFDQYSRQSRALQIIDALRKPSQKFTILDVGGYKGVTSIFHDQDKVTVLDVFDVEEPNYIQGDATKLDMKDSSFDFVVSFDVFEHIPAEKRDAFVSECARVAKLGIIIAAPVGTKENAFSENELNELFKYLHNKDHEWLKEHIDYVLPKPDLAIELMKKNKLQVTTFTSNYTPLWLLMQSTIFAASKFEVVGKNIEELYSYYNTQLPSDGVPNYPENYRVIALGLKDKKDHETIKSKVKDIFIDNEKYFTSTVNVMSKATDVLIRGLNELFEALNKSEAKVNQQNNQIGDLTNRLEIATGEIAEIKNSKSYKLAQKISKTSKKLRITKR